MIKRPAYIIRLGAALGSVLSRLFNVGVLHGEELESTSARSYREPWPRAVKFINAALWIFERDHCRKAWEKEVLDARKTLARDDLLK
jgi:hypothetical protein